MTSSERTEPAPPPSASALPPPPHGSKMAVRKAVRQAILQQAQAEWRGFPDLPGKHLYLRKSGWSSWELVNDGTGMVEVRCASSAFARFPKAVIHQGRTYEWRRVGKRQLVANSRVRELVNMTTKSPVLRRSGVHFNGRAGTRISLAGTEFIFPVRGRRASAVMSAVDRLGNHVIEYRSTKRQSKLTTEIVISPNALTIPQIQLLAFVSSRLLFDFFQSGGGG